MGVRDRERGKTQENRVQERKNIDLQRKGRV